MPWVVSGQSFSLVRPRGKVCQLDEAAEGLCMGTPAEPGELPLPSGRRPAQAHTYNSDFLAFDTGKGPEKDKI